MTFTDNAFAEFLSNPRVKREWDNLSNGAVHRQENEEPFRVTAQTYPHYDMPVSSQGDYND